MSLTLRLELASGRLRGVKLRRLLPMLTLLALLVAPFGRVAAADAMNPHRQTAASMAGHCDDMPAPRSHRGDRPHKATIDCLIGCAAMATAEPAPLVGARASVALPATFALPAFSGLHPEAEPPPPRLY